MKRYIACILLLCLVFCGLTGCGSRTPTTAEVFTQTMEEAGFTIYDITEEDAIAAYATKILVATNNRFRLEFYELNDEETGQLLYDALANALEDQHSTKLMSTKLSMGNYDYFAFTSGDDFHLVTRIDNTILFCDISKDYKSDVLEFVKTFGYK